MHSRPLAPWMSAAPWRAARRGPLSQYSKPQWQSPEMCPLTHSFHAIVQSPMIFSLHIFSYFLIINAGCCLALESFFLGKEREKREGERLTCWRPISDYHLKVCPFCFTVFIPFSNKTTKPVQKKKKPSMYDLRTYHIEGSGLVTSVLLYRKQQQQALDNQERTASWIFLWRQEVVHKACSMKTLGQFDKGLVKRGEKEALDPRKVKHRLDTCTKHVTWI